MAKHSRKKGNPAAALVAVLILILMVVALVVVVRSFTDKPGGDESPAPPSAETGGPSPTETAPPEIETPPPTETPEPTVEPTETPEPTPEPTPEEVIDASGSFKSATATGLELVVDWAASSLPEEKMKLTVTLSAESYSLYSSAAWQAAKVTVAGEEQAFDTLAISYDGPGLGKNKLGSAVFTLDAAASVDISASWRFAGVYGGEEVETISAAGTAEMG